MVDTKLAEILENALGMPANNGKIDTLAVSFQSMAITCEEEILRCNHDKVHVYTWSDDSAVVERVVLLVHGFMMHGKSFDALASFLASHGSLVIAPDLRGFGRHYYFVQDEKQKIDYSRSLDDLTIILEHVAEKYSHTPLFCLGESLGSHFARSISARHPELVSGLILSSPCMRPQLLSLPLIPHACTELIRVGSGAEKQFDIAPFAREFLKHEQNNLKHYLEDPLTRKSIEILELIDAFRLVGEMENARVPGHIPVLVFRGANDCVCTASSAKKFLESLDERSLTIHTSKKGGHLLMQSRDADEELFGLLLRWCARVASSI